MPKTPAEMILAVIRNLEKNTGRDEAAWRAVLQKEGPRDEKAQYDFLRKKGLGHVAAKVLSGGMKPYDAPDQLVDAQYAGDKARLRPIYEAVLAVARELGSDVDAKPCKTYVPLHRSKTFAVVKPERTRVDVGLCLGAGVKPEGRLSVAKHLGSDRVTHKIQLGSPGEVDGELIRWLRRAYESA
jgi:hypothetical protein